MNNDRVYRFNAPGQISEAEIRAEMAASKRYWSSPEGRARQRQLDARNRENRSAKFPDLAASKGTHPLDEVRDWAARFGK